VIVALKTSPLTRLIDGVDGSMLQYLPFAPLQRAIWQYWLGLGITLQYASYPLIELLEIVIRSLSSISLQQVPVGVVLIFTVPVTV